MAAARTGQLYGNGRAVQVGDPQEGVRVPPRPSQLAGAKTIVLALALVGA